MSRARLSQTGTLEQMTCLDFPPRTFMPSLHTPSSPLNLSESLPGATRLSSLPEPLDQPSYRSLHLGLELQVDSDSETPSREQRRMWSLELREAGVEMNPGLSRPDTVKNVPRQH